MIIRLMNRGWKDRETTLSVTQAKKAPATKNTTASAPWVY